MHEIPREQGVAGFRLGGLGLLRGSASDKLGLVHGASSLDQPLSELTVLIVDCQTTGATPKQGAVLELGWCLARGSDPELEQGAEAHWIALPAGERVSAPVRELTGFSEAVLADALAPEQAWARLCATMTEQRPMPAAIHFARFELTFLRDFCERFQPDTAFPIDAVCVHAIACRLYPDLPRRNLRALAGFLGHGLHLERRSLGHVLATAFIWRKLAAELSARGIASWAELGTWLAAKEKPATPRKRTYPLPRERCRALPDEPGVYRFLRSNGDVLYVGKATSLKKRVTSHFSKQRGATERALEMLTQVSDIAVTVSASPLEAALLETDLIKSLNPPYNVQLVQGERGAWFASVELDSAATTPDERHRLGPLPSRFSVRCLRALCELLEGEAPTVQRRAAVVGAPLAFAPDVTSFAEGFAAFRERHALRLSEQRGGARARAFAIARTLLLSAAPEDAEGQSEAEEAAELDAPVWDAARVCRHLERSAAAAYQVLRRASWLCLLAESVVTFREPRARVGRSLVLQGARVVELADQGADEVVSLGPRRRRGASREAFDAARYDELRILTTELKRILRDGGEVAVRLSARRVLSGSRLASLLRLV